MTDSCPDTSALGLYVHFPWCVKKCPYCDLNSHPIKESTDQQAYLNALLLDWRQQHGTFGRARIAESNTQQVSSIFFGGGTPSLFEPQYLARLLEEVPHRGAEITLEVNPGTAEYFRFEDYKAAGINRLSIGAQSFSNTQLAQLGRVHQRDETVRAVAKARHAGLGNINLDIMWGLPGQSVEGALDDLQQAIDLEPKHISWYQLTIEPKTEFAGRPPILPVDPVLQEIEQAGLALLADAGFQRYEVSAFSQQGHQCQHNLIYWSFGDYLGIGAGAHGKISQKDDIYRTQRPSQPRLYQQDSQITELTLIPDAQRPIEFMMNALRLIDGVPQQTFAERTQLPWQSVREVWQELVSLELVRQDRCATTPLGLRYLDSVLERFLS